jgi:cell division protein FtsW
MADYRRAGYGDTRATNAGQSFYNGEYTQREQHPAKQNRGVTVAGTMDYTIYLVVIILTLIGVVMVFSSSYLYAGTRAAFNNDPFYFLKRNLMMAGIGFVVMNILANFPYRHLRRFAWLAYVISLGLLVAVLFVGIASNNAVRWLPLPYVGQFQPSEVMKAALALLLAVLIERNRDMLKSWRGFWFCIILVALAAGFVYYGGLSSAIIVAVIGMGIIFIASPYLMRFVVIGGSAAASLVGVLWYLSTDPESMRGGRFAAWLDPFAYQTGKGYQTVQSLYAIASGGMFGVGIGQSRQKTFLPEAYNDIIYSIICEELGYAGGIMVLLLFGILFWRGIRAARKAPDTFGMLMAAGIVLTIASQVLINVAVVTNSIPNTGVTMPFVSYGGTSLIICMGMMGILLNISRYTREDG